MEMEVKEIIKEKEKVYEDGHDRISDKASKSLAGTALGIGIGGTVLGGLAALGAWNKRGGCGGHRDNDDNGGIAAISVYGKECSDVLNLTKGMYDLAIAGMTKAAAAREVDTSEKFGIYKSQVDGDFGNYKATRDLYDAQTEKLNNAAFGLYKAQRDSHDELKAQICHLEGEIARMQAVRPYQDRLIQCDIEKSQAFLVNYVDRLDCRNIKGVVTLPNDPTITGLPSYRNGWCGQPTTTPAAG